MIELADHFELYVTAVHIHDLIAAEVAARLLDRIETDHRRGRLEPPLRMATVSMLAYVYVACW
jgi:hypothetical protein